jgi:hypothetical protein
MSRKSQETLSREARRLKSADARVVKALAETDWNSLAKGITEFADARKKIMAASADLDVIQVYDSVTREVLERLRHGKPYVAHAVAESLETRLEDGAVLTRFSESELDELGHELLYSWVSHFEYAEALLDTASLLVDVHLPADLVRYVSEARQCFAFQQYNAVVSLCRTIMESAARDANRRRGRAPTKVTEISRGEAKRRVLEAAPRHINQEVRDLYEDTSELIHARKTASRTEARDILSRTLRAVSTFYSALRGSRPTRRWS